ncbi:MAG: hypothetical protein QG605_1528 [Euryarchaeota archaeon]|nr:hypothetical protein [Euryarchaeota archaeon]
MVILWHKNAAISRSVAFQSLLLLIDDIPLHRVMDCLLEEIYDLLDTVLKKENDIAGYMNLELTICILECVNLCYNRQLYMEFSGREKSSLGKKSDNNSDSSKPAVLAN